MLLNYYRTGIRNILKYKVFSAINIFGLATGMAVCMLIMVMFSDQKEYDQFHSKKERIYRLLTVKPDAMMGMKSAVTSAPLGLKLKNDYAIIDESTRLNLGIGGDAMYNRKTVELRGYFADQSFFNIFDYTLDAGNRATALTLPNSMIITHSAAVELFGSENPIGKAIAFSDRGLPILKGIDIEKATVYWGEYTVTGVVNDQSMKSHLRFDALVSASSMPVLIKEKKIDDYSDNWLDHNSGYTYVTLTRGKAKQDLLSALDDIVQREYKNVAEAKGITLDAQKLTEITPGLFMSSPPSFSLPLQIYYFLLLLALVILISACLNYTTLATARSLTRVKEIGIRKVTGASRRSLIFQFLSESILTSFFSLILAIGLLYLIRPAFNELWINQYLGFDLGLTPSIYLGFGTLAISIGLLAGIYPALYLSRFPPIKVLKAHRHVKAGKVTMQRALNTIQFVVSLFFIITALLLYKQFDHHLKLDYGFVSKNIINVSLQSAEYNAAKTALSNIPGVVIVSACNEIVGSGQGTHGIGLKKPGATEETTAMQMAVDQNFLSNLELKLLAGNNVPEYYSNKQIVVNESAAKALGYEIFQEIIGETFESGKDQQVLEVVGVVKDFRFRMASEKDKVEPMVLRHQEGRFRFLQLKVISDDMTRLVTQLEKEWKKVDPNHTVKYQFFDEQLRATNKGLLDVVSIINVISFLAVLIACMGLLGMITYQTERKKKEVGIRKVLGADMKNIVMMLSKNFFIMLTLAVFISGPLSYFVNNLWLQNFPNRVDFGFELVAAGAAILLGLGVITIASTTLKASKTNPVEALRMD
ncbi:MAG: FtsX-like permease family protein [Chryseolinea sp.]